MKKSLLTRFTVLIALVGTALPAFAFDAASAEEIGFYCESSPWQSEVQGSPAYVKSVSCEKIESGFFSSNLLKKAQKICDQAAMELKLPHLNAVVLDPEACHYTSVSKSQALKEQHIDELDSDQLYSQGMWFEVFIDNRSKESPIYRTDGVEQAQWVEVGGKNYCGFPGQGLIFHVNEGQTFSVMNLKTGNNVKFDFILSKNNIDTYRQSPPFDKSLPEFIDHSLQMGFFDISLYNYRASGKSDFKSYPVALMDRLNQRLCVRTQERQ